MNPEELKGAATALLATVKKVMTGAEIAAREWAKSADPYEDEDYSDDYDIHTDRIERPANQFPREIRNWLDSRDRAYARRRTSIAA